MNTSVMEKPTHNRVQAMENLQNFIEEYPITDLKDSLYQLYKGWMLNNMNKVDGDEVLNMLLFYDQLRGFIEQVYLLKDGSK